MTRPRLTAVPTYLDATIRAAAMAWFAVETAGKMVAFYVHDRRQSMDERYPTDGAAIAAREADVDALRGRCETAEAEARDLRALLAEVADWMSERLPVDGGCTCPCCEADKVEGWPLSARINEALWESTESP